MFDTATNEKEAINELSDIYITDAGISSKSDSDYKLSSIKTIIEFNNNPDLKRDFELELSNALLNSTFEYGYISECDKVFNHFHNICGVVAVDWLNEYFIDNIQKSIISLGILRILSRQKYSDIGAQGKMILIICAHQFKDDFQIQDAIIRVVENWEAHDLIDILNQLSITEGWLNDFRSSVIEDLQSQCLI